MSLFLISRRAFSSLKPPTSQEVADKARQADRFWDTWIPERNIGITHPMFFVLGGLALGLHVYNNNEDEKLERELRERRLGITKEDSL